MTDDYATHLKVKADFQKLLRLRYPEPSENFNDMLDGPPDPKPETVLGEAERLIYGDRMEEYGDAYEEALRIAAGWEVILGCKVSPEKPALCMVWLKICRELAKSKRDNIVDAAGYLGLVEKVYLAEP